MVSKLFILLIIIYWIHTRKSVWQNYKNSNNPLDGQVNYKYNCVKCKVLQQITSFKINAINLSDSISKNSQNEATTTIVFISDNSDIKKSHNLRSAFT